MKIRNDKASLDVKNASLVEAALTQYRKERGFNVDTYVADKCAKLVDYFKRCNLSTAVVGVSGGVDSAVTLGILVKAGIPVVAVSLPVPDTDGATNQSLAEANAKVVCDTFGVPCNVMDLAPAFEKLRVGVEDSTGLQSDAWARGQLVSYLRTPALYYATSLLASAGRPACVVGTTNLDEGAWLGYFGKASDGMVDVQAISDIHKSEVLKVAEALGLPSCITAQAPTGDMFDGKTDEEVFGVSYDMVELFYCHKKVKPLDFDFSQIDKMHQYNLHKYKCASPAIHLDLWDCQIPGGWQYNVA